MTTQFKRIEPGMYEANIGYGYKALIVKGRKSWLGTLRGPQGHLIAVKGGNVEYWGDTKVEVERALIARADLIEVDDQSAMDGRAIKVKITTPWCCNPASETYWSM